MARINIVHDDIYKEIRAYLVEMFDTKSVVKSIQNGSPLPENAVVMNIINEENFDVPYTRYQKESESADAYQSVGLLMQIDFYGDEAGKRARILSNLWRNHYSTDRLKQCQPLYSKEPLHAPFVNEKSKYEDRYIVELKLQYNPVVTHKQHFVDGVAVQLNKL